MIGNNQHPPGDGDIFDLVMANQIIKLQFVKNLINKIKSIEIAMFLQKLIDAIFIHKGAKTPDQKPDKHRRIML